MLEYLGNIMLKRMDNAMLECMHCYVGMYE